MGRITKRKRSAYQFDDEKLERNRPINRIVNEVEGGTSKIDECYLFYFEGKEADIRDYENFRDWTEDLDIVVIDTLYDDFVNKNMKKPYKVTNRVIEDAISNITRNYKILISDEEVRDRVDVFKDAVKRVTEITQLEHFQWCDEQKKIIGDKYHWDMLIDKNVNYIFYKNCRLPYYPGKLPQIFC
ncbi:hypothetical protein FRX31_025026 [Thalictrum thalictroides]|uniref:Myb/SANT-like domain-containing protein n=1 Tax=Thalictrum thalictroides TaxID=46969 RepID=A0A7J6VJU8_THATH|nr:hypothetical protein FRX31_025026 [Thalictrum thalictroides]